MWCKWALRGLNGRHGRVWSCVFMYSLIRVWMVSFPLEGSCPRGGLQQFHSPEVLPLLRKWKVPGRFFLPLLCLKCVPFEVIFIQLWIPAHTYFDTPLWRVHIDTAFLEGNLALSIPLTIDLTIKLHGIYPTNYAQAFTKVQCVLEWILWVLF